MAKVKKFIGRTTSADGYANDVASIAGSLNRVHFTSADLAALPEYGNRTELTFRFYVYDSFSGPNNRRIGLEEIKISAVPSG